MGNTHKFETLIKGNAPKDENYKWYPYKISKYREAFLVDTSTEENLALLNNICSNMQYLEFLNKELNELELSAVLKPMTIKYFVITGMSILEGLFTYIIKSNNLWRMEHSKSIGCTTSNAAKFGENRYEIKTELLELIPEKPADEMNLDSLIQKLDGHHKLLKIDNALYPALKRLRKLRNRVHLNNSINNKDTDYYLFTDRVKEEMSSILYQILTSENIGTSSEVFDFLKSEPTPVSTK